MGRATAGEVQRHVRNCFENNTSITSHTAKNYFDRYQKDLQFKVGDFVWLYGPKSRIGAPRKLEPNRWLGPCKILKKLSDCVYFIRRDGDRAGRVVNVDRLAPFIRRDPVRFPPLTGEQDAVDEPRSPRRDSTESSGEGETDNNSDENEESSTDGSPVLGRLPTKRPQRQRRQPAR